MWNGSRCGLTTGAETNRMMTSLLSHSGRTSIIQ